jgi:CMP-N,N'-diacetyllegionaminic acid synthase
MIAIVIPAKGGSTRLPNKNMSLLNGRPMIDFSIEAAKSCEVTDLIFVSTDSEAIASHAKDQGVSVIMRPESLGGEVPIIEVYRHSVANMPENSGRIETLIGLQPDHPDRDVSIDEAYRVFSEADADFLYTTEADGTKNGSHYILSRSYLDGGEMKKDVRVIDDCTNVHYAEDLVLAGDRLKRRE